MTRRRRPGRRSGPDEGGVDGAVLAILVLSFLVGGLVWRIADDPVLPRILIENPGTQARTVDVVWKNSVGTVSGSLLHTVEPTETLVHSLRNGMAACIRWIDEPTGSIEAVRPVPVRGRSHVLVVLGSSPARHARMDRCPRELVEHPIRPRLGRRMTPDQPGETYRERLIPRTLHRRQVRRRDTGRRGSGGEVLPTASSGSTGPASTDARMSTSRIPRGSRSRAPGG